MIVKKVVSDIRFKGYLHHASKGEPQYIIKRTKPITLQFTTEKR